MDPGAGRRDLCGPELVGDRPRPVVSGHRACGAGAGAGDSGSPVFERVGPSEVALTGIMWGFGTGAFGEPLYAFSAFEHISLELGALTTF
jgi:hypothetical protein